MNLRARRVTGWVVGLGALAVLGALAFRPSKDAANAGSARVAPRFAALTIDSVPQPRTLDDYAGEPLLLNVWATWCDPCREEMPSFERLQQDYRTKGLRVVAISIDDADQGALIREFVAENALTFDILHDPKSEIMKLYQVRGVPQTFLVSRAGHIMATRFAADWSTPAYRALVDSLLELPGG